MTTQQGDHDIREPGPGEVSYAGQGIWMTKPIPNVWRQALLAAVAHVPALGKQPDIARLIAAPTIEEEANGAPIREEVMKVCKIKITAPGSDGELDIILTKEQYLFLMELAADWNAQNTLHAQPFIDVSGYDRATEKKE